MTKAKNPVLESVTIPFDNGRTQLTSVIDPSTGVHSVTCDLCNFVIALGPRGLAICISEHQGHDKCQQIALNGAKAAAKKQNLVSD